MHNQQAPSLKETSTVHWKFEKIKANKSLKDEENIDWKIVQISLWQILLLLPWYISYQPKPISQNMIEHKWQNKECSPLANKLSNLNCHHKAAQSWWPGTKLPSKTFLCQGKNNCNPAEKLSCKDCWASQNQGRMSCWFYTSRAGLHHIFH